MPYGQVLQGGDALQPYYGYNGEEYHPGTGLQFLRARHYAPQRGAFLTEDTYGGEMLQPLTQNLYLYALGDPVNYKDPGGNAAKAKAPAPASNTKPTATTPTATKAGATATTTAAKAKSNTVPAGATKAPAPAKAGTTSSSSGSDHNDPGRDGGRFGKDGNSGSATTYQLLPLNIDFGTPSAAEKQALEDLIRQIGTEKIHSLLPHILDMQVLEVKFLGNRLFCSAEAMKVNALSGEWSWFISSEDLAEGVSQFRRMFVKDAEWELFKKYPLESIRAQGYSMLAKSVERHIYGSNQIDGTPGNAFLHAYWNALMSYFLGSDFAEKFGTAHEAQDDPAIFDRVETDGFTVRQHANMDLYNNAVGREIGTSTKQVLSNKTSHEVLLQRYGSEEQIKVQEEMYGTTEITLLLAIYTMDALTEGRLTYLRGQ